jgi:hypothetical protein|uniref:Uncharacterized protein n=1 Tax=Myoviridae sp. ctu2j3 TaxID=2825197 RepID=A0A8S5UHX6_9CAUD|nr:MAG TPA: hypothetical protein [Myoviridae sp. ctu2j3]DAF94318.1 MAG TPA: hypothetical protein [Myoviridae sp. ctu2j3]
MIHTISLILLWCAAVINIAQLVTRVQEKKNARNKTS